MKLNTPYGPTLLDCIDIQRHTRRDPALFWVTLTGILAGMLVGAL